jgi:hypothetical protein
MSDSDANGLPKADAVDVVYTIIKAGVAGIPYIGGPAAQILAAVIAPPINRRRDLWFEDLAERLSRIEGKVAGFTLEALGENEAFLTTVLQATQTAARTHQKEKHEALRNAVLNTALGHNPNEDKNLMFLRFIDELMPSHLDVLAILHDPQGEYSRRGVPWFDTSFPWGGRNLIHRALDPEEKYVPFYDQVVRDLYTRGLIDIESVGITFHAGEIGKRRTTHMGEEFLVYITAPPEDTAESRGSSS